MSRPFRILAVDHTGITVRDLDVALQFWCDIMGFELLYRVERDGAAIAQVVGVAGARIALAVVTGFGHKIELLQYLAPEDRDAYAPQPCDLGSLHLAFTIDSLDAALAHLSACGWSAAGVPQTMASGSRAGTRLVYLRDPDGTTIELLEPPKTA